MINILFFISGCIITFTLTSFLSKKVKKEYIPPKRGLLKNEYSAHDGITGKSENIAASLEILEIESSDTKSKVKVLEIIIDKSRYNTEDWKKKIRAMTDNTWIDSSSIEWINKSKSTERAEKLDKILN